MEFNELVKQVTDKVMASNEIKEIVTKDEHLFAFKSKDAFDAYVKELVEAVDVEKGIGKAGFGITANDAEPVDYAAVKALFDAVAVKDFETARRLSGKTKDLNTNTGAAGGFLVPQAFSTNVINRVENYGFLRQNATVFPMGSDNLTIPTVTSEPLVQWIGQGKTIKKGNPTFGKINLTVAKVGLIVPWTNEVAEDSAIALLSLLQEMLARGIARAEDDMAINGDGTVFMGLMNHTGVNTYTLGATKTTIDKVTADDLLYLTDNIYSSEEATSKYLMHRTVANRFHTLRDGASNYLFPLDVQKFWKYSYIETPIMPKVSDLAAGSKVAIFGDFKNIYLGDRRQLTVEIADQATLELEDGTKINLFDQDMKALKITERISIQIAIPEQFTILKLAAA